MNTLYVVAKRILLTTGSFYVERGDILTFSTANRNTLTIHRAQKIVKTMPFTQGGLNAFVRTGMIQLFHPIPGPKVFPGQPVNEVPST